MEYVLKQFYFDGKTLKSNWMNPITDVKTIKIKNKYYTDIGLRINKTNTSVTGFDVNSSYYCACYIYGQNDIQVKLATTESVNNEDYYTPSDIIQNIAAINTKNSDEWHLVDFVFTPQDIGFNTIYCEYNRKENTLNFIPPKIVFLELSEIQNLKNINEIDNSLYRKIGIQSRPGLRMLINSEEIRVGRTGVYELKNSDIKIESIGMIQMAQEWKSPAEQEKNLNIEDIKTQLQELTDDYIDDEKFNYIAKVIPDREFYSFVLDYIYEQASAETNKQSTEA